ncbi:MAG: endonuclease Q family protein [Armatimonadota bacterium]|nr:endonuclease Q family protein [Armatimonadota bacterium]MDR7448532.1 endonuclease Q family protein [Armatimonadota bacterium]MDR7460235.1 endonuclease Q family protein [Armatimonadota bacterium]MDR7478955.1 endonuclease Q family protein [Armatimonadota bacterium]MDR7488353.1 endonuclease Q family protein [Armatimonadota bacterium]
MRVIADLHLHSKYSRATSRDMDIEHLARWGQLKGLTLLGTGDFTHPVWFRELRARLTPTGRGLFTAGGMHFVLSVEVANIYPQGGRLRKIHNILLAPSFETAERINAVLGRFGSLIADGRPSLSLPSDKLVEYVMELDPQCLVIPAHVWTPWFSLYGSNSGFDSLEECFKDQTCHIAAVETGLSSDPPMNWRLSELDRVALVSNSDAHSPAKLGREANVFEMAELDYGELVRILRQRDTRGFLYTIEFFPEEGKYHYDGHRNCGLRLTPKETRALGGVCPTCRRPLTVGVMHRVELLADREEGFVPEGAVPYRNLIPLEEVIAEARGAQVGTGAVREEYLTLCREFGGEFRVLLDVPLEEVARHASPRVVEGLRRMREGCVVIKPGYDGVFGEIHLFEEAEEVRAELLPDREEAAAQISLF